MVERTDIKLVCDVKKKRSGGAYCYHAIMRSRQEHRVVTYGSRRPYLAMYVGIGVDPVAE